MAMTPFHKEVLKTCLPTLCDDMDPDSLIPHLIGDGIITDRDQEDLDAVPQRYKKAEKLVDILKRRGDRAYEAFINALENSDGSSHLADEIREKENRLRQQQPMEGVQGGGDAAIRNPTTLLTDKDLTKLASEFGAEWKQVARMLGLNSAEIYRCEAENRFSIQDQVFAMLHKWKCRKQIQATVSELHRELSQISSVDPNVFTFLENL